MQLTTYQNAFNTESPAILLGVARGDKTAIKNCIETYGNLIWTLARKYTDSIEEAETATEEIFFDIWRSADRFDPMLLDEAVFIFLVAQRRLIKGSARINRDFFEQQQDFITQKIRESEEPNKTKVNLSG